MMRNFSIAKMCSHSVCSGQFILERFRFFNVYMYDKRYSEHDAINGISGSGNPTIVSVSQD